ncbi:cadherin domain-containing protein [Spongiivirga sp. MCCC 1A20706]|uniref:cadherin domain-containing protein n=1 Tax=Spongiivirga sp. MCCC 1A20706 TaxID=3160963 RepID=UPI003977809E
MNKSFLSKAALSLLIIGASISCGGDDDNPTPPQNASPVIQAQTFTAAENIGSTTEIGQIQATDPDDDDLTFSLVTDADDLFEVSDDGELTLESGKILDFETKTSHTIEVEVNDGELGTTATVTINVTDIDENTNSAPVFDAQTFSAQENVTGRGAVVATLVATDPDNDAITFSWDPAGNVTAFELNSNTGEIRTVNNAQGDLDFETTPQYVVSVIASDGMAQTQADITINVTDFNDRPVFGGGSYTVAEDVDDTFVIGSLVATDQDGDTLTFAIESDPDDLFEITNGTDVSLQTGKSLDFETAVSHAIDVSVTDGTETVINTFNISVTDVVEAIQGTVSTFAGESGTSGSTNGIATTARFNGPEAIAKDAQGNIYVSDLANQRIRKIDVNGNVSTFGIPSTVLNGTADITCKGLVVDPRGRLFISDFNRNRILMVTGLSAASPTFRIHVGATDGTSGYTDQPGTNARFNGPAGLAIANNGRVLVADSGNHVIRGVGSSTGSGNAVITIMGRGTQSGNQDGSSAVARFNSPNDVAVDANGVIYVADTGNHRIRSVDASLTNVVTVAGSTSGFNDDQGTQAQFDTPTGIVVDENDFIYVADASNNTIRRIDSNGNVISLTTNAAGATDGDLSAASFNRPKALCFQNSTDLLVVDTSNHSIRKIEF